MVKKNSTSTDVIDCACVIHGSGYDWIYVERLYNMMRRHLHRDMRFHVYTEASRSVPDHMIKHALTEWPDVAGPKKSWWYKMQLFNSGHHQGNLLYFDLDTVILRDIDWIVELNPEKLWTIRDFRRLQNASWSGMNSSIMWWNVPAFDWLWYKFQQSDLDTVMRQHRQGDQDYIMKQLGHTNVRFFEDQLVQSWRWQAFEGGRIFPYQRTQSPGTGTHVSDQVSVLVFHGNPKPHELLGDVVIKQHWC